VEYSDTTGVRSTTTTDSYGSNGELATRVVDDAKFDATGNLVASETVSKSYGADGSVTGSEERVYEAVFDAAGQKTSDVESAAKFDAKGNRVADETRSKSYGADGSVTWFQVVIAEPNSGGMAETGRTEFFDADGNSMGVREDYRDATTDRFSSYDPGGIPPEVPNASGPQKDWSVNSSLEAPALPQDGVPVNSGGIESEMGGPWSFEVKRYDATADENLTRTEKTAREVLTDPAGAVTGYRESVDTTEQVYRYTEPVKGSGRWVGTLVETRVTTREDVFDADRKIISSRDRIEIYDPKGKLISSETTSRDSGTLQQTGKEVVNDPYGNAVGFIESQKATDADGSWRERTNSYDPSGNLTGIVETAKVVLSNADGDYAGYRRSFVSDSVDRSRSYDADGRLTSAVEIIVKPPIAVDAPVAPVWSAPADGYVGQSRSTLANTYDGDGMLTGSRETTKEVLTDAEGKVIGYRELDRGADVDSWWQQTQNYDAKGKPQQGREMRNGRIEGQKYALVDGNGLFAGYRETYTDAGVEVSRDYDIYGELTLSTEKHTDTDGSITTETVEYSYGLGGARLLAREVFSSGDYELSYIYDSRGVLTSSTEKLMNTDGSTTVVERFYSRKTGLDSTLPDRYDVVSGRETVTATDGTVTVRRI
jgi:hypothetical protein